MMPALTNVRINGPRVGMGLGWRVLGTDTGSKRRQSLLVSWVQLRENSSYGGFAADDTSGGRQEIRRHNTGIWHARPLPTRLVAESSSLATLHRLGRPGRG